MAEEIGIKMPEQIKNHFCTNCKKFTALYWIDKPQRRLQWFCYECKEEGFSSP